MAWWRALTQSGRPSRRFAQRAMRRASPSAEVAVSGKQKQQHPACNQGSRAATQHKQHRIQTVQRLVHTIIVELCILVIWLGSCCVVVCIGVSCIGRLGGRGM